MTYRQRIGTEYEYYVLEHIRNNYEKVWHWKDFPEKQMYELNLITDYDKFKKYRTDIGADLVAFKDNKYYFIQCKNFKETIYIDTLAGFYYLLYENNLNGILYYSGTLSERLVDLSTGKIPFINLPFNNENIIFKEIKEKIKPRDYQLEAYTKLKNLDKCILSLPCSMGKTYVSSMLGKDYDNVIILSPTRALTQQNLKKFKEYLNKDYNYILVSIDGKTNIDEINKIIKPKNIISSTYDSCNIVNLLIDKLKKCYIIIDEFHNLSDNNINDANNEINKLINYNANKLFVSATPIKDFMEIPETNIYTYKWDDAIKNKYICDFNIYLPNISKELIKFMEIIKNNYNDMELKLIKKAYNLVKSMLFNGDKKCICYLTTIEKATTFNKILTLIANTFNIEIEKDQIDCTTKRLKRNEIIEKFKKSKELYILLNVHVLDEGIDIPECDSVYITQPNNNIINIVQRMCRANRIYKNKSECNIYLWCTVIHHYLRGEPIEINGKIKMLYITEVIDGVKKSKTVKIFYKLTSEIEKIIIDCGIKKKDIRAMTTDERYAFNDTQLSFISIQKQIDKHTKCNLFNRLQQGERANCGTMTKNSDHPMTNYIRDNNIITQYNYDANWKCILSHPRIKEYKYDELLNRITFIIIRLLYITDKKSLEVNYNDSKMASYIRENFKSSYLSDNTQIDKLYKKIMDINNTIKQNITELKITEEFYYLIHKLILDNNLLIKNISLLLENKELNKKYNNILFYKKSVNSKIVGSDMTKNYNELIKDLTEISTPQIKKKINNKIIIEKNETNDDDEEEIIIVKPKKKVTVNNYDNLNI